MDANTFGSKVIHRDEYRGLTFPRRQQVILAHQPERWRGS
jgi:hypothetical protein